MKNILENRRDFSLQVNNAKHTMKKRVKKKKAKSEPGQKKTQKVVEGEAEEKPFNFGGLPERSLKKNLGC